MFQPGSRSRFVAGIAVVALAMSGSAGAAALITSKQIKDGTIQIRDIAPKARSFTRNQSDLRYRTKSITLPGVAFHPIDSASSLAETYPGIGAVHPLSGTDPVFYASLPLPPGAKITELTVYALDNDASNDITVVTGAVADNASGDGSVAATVVSSGADAAYRVFTTLPTTQPWDSTGSAPWITVKFGGATPDNDTLVLSRVVVEFALPN